MEKNIFQEFLEQFKAPWKHTAFKIYFTVIILGFGCADIWVSVHDYFDKPDIYAISQNISGFFVALIAASTADLWTSLTFRNMLSLVFLCIGIIGFSFVLYLFCYSQHGVLGLIASLVGAAISLAIWIVSNSADDKWSDDYFYNKMRGADVQHAKTW